jgi:murein DD-endopeptidase MepM/ murein hydrolase activator NlpD
MPHQGTDFGAPTGTPIHAASYGVINKLGPLGPNGNFIGIQHAKGYETGYSHLSRFEPGLKEGDKVESLQVIGYVGSTGRSTGPHLHFSAKKDGAFIDPESLHLDALVVLPTGERTQFDEVRRSYDRLLDAIALPEALAAVPAPAPAATTDSESDGEFAPNNPPEPMPSAPPTPGAPAGAPVVVAPGAQRNSVYLSDKDLVESQSASDDGEVEE